LGESGRENSERHRISETTRAAADRPGGVRSKRIPGKLKDNGSNRGGEEKLKRGQANGPRFFPSKEARREELLREYIKKDFDRHMAHLVLIKVHEGKGGGDDH